MPLMAVTLSVDERYARARLFNSALRTSVANINIVHINMCEHVVAR